jgi:hypothetical protein
MYSLLTLPWTTACSPNTITLPGAETMKAGIIGVDCFLSWAKSLLPFFVPLIWVRSRFSPIPLTVPGLLTRRDISTGGEGGGLLSDGVSIGGEVVPELVLERACVWRGFPLNDRLVEVLVIARRAYSRRRGKECGRGISNG